MTQLEACGCRWCLIVLAFHVILIMQSGQSVCMHVIGESGLVLVVRRITLWGQSKLREQTKQTQIIVGESRSLVVRSRGKHTQVVIHAPFCFICELSSFFI